VISTTRSFSFSAITKSLFYFLKASLNQRQRLVAAFGFRLAIGELDDMSVKAAILGGQNHRADREQISPLICCQDSLSLKNKAYNHNKQVIPSYETTQPGQAGTQKDKMPALAPAVAPKAPVPQARDWRQNNFVVHYVAF
jgi:hypothetical protein